MVSRNLLLLLLPFVVVALVNPLTILGGYATGSGEAPPNAKIRVNGEASDLVVKSGDKLSMSVSYFLKGETKLRVEAVDGSTVSIDGVTITDGVYEAKPGEHFVSYETRIPDVSLPSKEVLLLIRPITNVESEKELRLSAFILPRNHGTIVGFALIATIMEFVGCGICFLSYFYINRHLCMKSNERNEALLSENKRLREKLKNAEQKIKAFYDVVFEFVESRCSPEDFSRYVERRIPRFVTPKADDKPEEVTEESDGFVKIHFPLQKLRRRKEQ
jgi:hypothetical protein